MIPVDCLSTVDNYLFYLCILYSIFSSSYIIYHCCMQMLMSVKFMAHAVRSVSTHREATCVNVNLAMI